MQEAALATELPGLGRVQAEGGTQLGLCELLDSCIQHRAQSGSTGMLQAFLTSSSLPAFVNHFFVLF